MESNQPRQTNHHTIRVEEVYLDSMLNKSKYVLVPSHKEPHVASDAYNNH